MAFELLGLSGDFLIPFVFMLAVVYGGMHLSGVIKNKAAIALISLAIAFFAASNADAIRFINGVLPLAVPFFIVVFFLSFVLEMFRKHGGAKKDYPLLIMIFALVLIFLLYVQRSTDFEVDESVLGIGGLIVFIMIFFTVYKIGKKED